MNILNLPAFTVLSVDEDSSAYRITAAAVEPPSFCPHCGVVSPNLYKFGHKIQEYADTPMHGKRTTIVFDRQRYRCRECQVTFWEPLQEMDDKRMMTRRLVNWLRHESVKRTFVSVANDVGLLEKTVRDVFKDFTAELETKYWPATPVWLGIDEIHLMGTARCVLANIETRTVYDILQDRTKQTLLNYITRRIPDAATTVECVMMDMHKPYRDVARLLMPDAQVIIDKFHVVKMATGAVEMVRKGLKGDMTPSERRTLMRSRFVLLKRPHRLNMRQQILLETYTKNVPILGRAYELKEGFYRIYDAEDQATAWEMYQAWKASIPEDLKPAFKPLTTAVGNWKHEIFAYFDYRLTNAYTEALNGLIRVIDRPGRGYSFDVLRAKLLFSEGVPLLGGRVPMTSFKKGHEYNLKTIALHRQGPVYLGADISTLTTLLELGEMYLISTD